MLRPCGPLCLSTDLFLENVHFRRSYFTMREIGHKALAVNASDLAACGARPLAFTLGLGLPSDIGMPDLEELFGGMAALAECLRMALAGGDLSRADTLCLSVTVWGEGGDASGDAAWLSRGGTRPGETLFLIGPVGLARVGLELLESEGRQAEAAWPAACAAHLTPRPQTAAGQILARLGQSGYAITLMDVSDGLARDLPRLLNMPESGLGAELLLPEAVLHGEVTRHARRKKRNPAWEAYLGGEDYALLGACSPHLLPTLHTALPGLWEIGTVTAGGHIRLNGAKLSGNLGFDHFAGAI